MKLFRWLRDFNEWLWYRRPVDVEKERLQVELRFVENLSALDTAKLRLEAEMVRKPNDEILHQHYRDILDSITDTTDAFNRWRAGVSDDTVR